MTTPEESPGERAVKAELIHMGLDFEEQHEIHGLKDDIKGNRRSDFYLTEHDIHIEVLGNWKNDGRHDHHIEEYKKKMEVYKNNNIDCIYIYPNQLTHSNIIIKKHIKEILINRSEKEREEKEEEAERKKEEQKRETENKKRAKKPINKKQEPITITVNAIPSSKTNKTSKQSWDIRMTLFLILVLIIIFTVISLAMNQAATPAPTTQKSLTNSSLNKTLNQTQPEKTINKTSIIKEILETNKYDNKEVTIIGGYDFPNNPNYKGYITDEQGNKILFTGTNRGFNPSKKYEYTGNVTLTNGIKYLKITGSINEIQ